MSSHSTWKSAETGSLGSSNKQQLVVKNTFLVFDDDGGGEDDMRYGMRRSNSGSNISSGSAPSRDEVESWLADSDTIHQSKLQSGKSSKTRQAGQEKMPVAQPTATSEPRGLNEEELIPDSGQAVTDSTWLPPPPSEESAKLFRFLFNGWLEAKANNTLKEFNDLISQMDEDGKLRPHVPKDQDGSSASLGSICHGEEPIRENCKPCIFFAARRCMLQDLCLHCHFFHPELAPKKQRASKAKRQRMAKAALKAEAEAQSARYKEPIEESTGDQSGWSRQESSRTEGYAGRGITEPYLGGGMTQGYSRVLLGLANAQHPMPPGASYQPTTHLVPGETPFPVNDHVVERRQAAIQQMRSSKQQRFRSYTQNVEHYQEYFPPQESAASEDDNQDALVSAPHMLWSSGSGSGSRGSSPVPSSSDITFHGPIVRKKKDRTTISL